MRPNAQRVWNFEAHTQCKNKTQSTQAGDSTASRISAQERLVKTQQGPRVPSLPHRDADKHKPVGQPKEGGGHFPPLREEVESRQSTNDSRSTKRETKCKSNIHPMPPIHRHTREAQSYTLSESEPSNALGVREAPTARSQMI